MYFKLKSLVKGLQIELKYLPSILVSHIKIFVCDVKILYYNILIFLLSALLKQKNPLLFSKGLQCIFLIQLIYLIHLFRSSYKNIVFPHPENLCCNRGRSPDFASFSGLPSQTFVQWYMLLRPRHSRGDCTGFSPVSLLSSYKMTTIFYMKL